MNIIVVILRYLMKYLITLGIGVEAGEGLIATGPFV